MLPLANSEKLTFNASHTIKIQWRLLYKYYKRELVNYQLIMQKLKIKTRRNLAGIHEMFKEIKIKTRTL